MIRDRYIDEYKNIRILSYKKIRLKNVSINININGEKYDSISRDAICKKSKDDYDNEFDVYISTDKSNLNLVEHVSKIYKIKKKYIYKSISEYKIILRDTEPLRMTYIRFVYNINITMPDHYYNNWLIRQRDETINNILCIDLD